MVIMNFVTSNFLKRYFKVLHFDRLNWKIFILIVRIINFVTSNCWKRSLKLFIVRSILMKLLIYFMVQNCMTTAILDKNEKKTEILHFYSHKNTTPRAQSRQKQRYLICWNRFRRCERKHTYAVKIKTFLFGFAVIR